MSFLLVLVSVALQTLAAWLVWSSGTDVAQLGTFLVVHALGAAALAWAVLSWLPLTFREPKGPALALSFSVAFFIPIGGMVVVLLSVLMLRWMPPRARANLFNVAHPPEFVISNRAPTRLFRGLSVRQLLVDVHAATSLRTRALNAIACKPPRISGDLLRKLLKDPVEDLRLVAYGLLDTRERELRARISEQTALLQRVSQAPGEHQVSLAEVLRRLAELNYELVYQSLVQGDVRDHTLGLAVGHAWAAIELDPTDGGLHQLLARIHLERNDPEQARVDLHRALEDGLPDNRVLPYMAEMAYQRRDWAGVRALMQRIDPLTVTPRMAALVRYWQTAGEPS